MGATFESMKTAALGENEVFDLSDGLGYSLYGNIKERDNPSSAYYYSQIETAPTRSSPDYLRMKTVFQKCGDNIMANVARFLPMYPDASRGVIILEGEYQWTINGTIRIAQSYKTDYIPVNRSPIACRRPSWGGEKYVVREIQAALDAAECRDMDDARERIDSAAAKFADNKLSITLCVLNYDVRSKNMYNDLTKAWENARQAVLAAKPDFLLFLGNKICSENICVAAKDYAGYGNDVDAARHGALHEAYGTGIPVGAGCFGRMYLSMPCETLMVVADKNNPADNISVPPEIIERAQADNIRSLRMSDDKNFTRHPLVTIPPKNSRPAPVSNLALTSGTPKTK
jgi:hypothetical protein